MHGFVKKKKLLREHEAEFMCVTSWSILWSLKSRYVNCARNNKTIFIECQLGSKGKITSSQIAKIMQPCTSTNTISQKYIYILYYL